MRWVLLLLLSARYAQCLLVHSRGAWLRRLATTSVYSVTLSHIRKNSRDRDLFYPFPTGPKKPDAWRFIMTDHLFNYTESSDAVTIPHSPLAFETNQHTCNVILQDGVLLHSDLNSSSPVTVRCYGTADELPESIVSRVCELPESTELELHDRTDAIGSEYLAWRSLKTLCSVIVIDVPEGHRAEKPLELQMRFTKRDSSAPLSHRLLLRMGTNSSLTLLQRFEGAPNDEDRAVDPPAVPQHRMSCHSTISLSEGSSLQHLVCQDLPVTFAGFDVCNVSLAAEAQYNLTTLLLGSKTFRMNAHAWLNGRAAATKFSGLALCERRRTHDFRLDVMHNCEKTISEQIYRAVLSNAATTIYKSCMFLPSFAQQSAAQQQFKALVLTTPCSVQAMPAIRLSSDNVDCKHGVAIADLEEEEVLYCQSRGLSREIARKLIMKGFVLSIMPEIVQTHPVLHAKIDSIMEAIASFDSR